MSNKIWITDVCNVIAIEETIHAHQEQGWIFHSFGVYGNGAVLLFYREETV